MRNTIILAALASVGCYRTVVRGGPRSSPDWLVPILAEQLKRAPGPWVFPRPDGSRQRKDVKLEVRLRRALGRAGIVDGYELRCRRCGTAEFRSERTTHSIECPRCGMRLWVTPLPKSITFHGLRHICASLHRRAGCDPLVIQVVLGHAPKSVTDQVYTHLDEGYVRGELNKLKLEPNKPTPGGAPNGGRWPPEPKAAGSNPASRALLGDTEGLLAVRDVARLLKVCRATVYRLVNSGRLPAVWVGAHRRILSAELSAFLAAGGAR